MSIPQVCCRIRRNDPGGDPAQRDFVWGVYFVKGISEEGIGQQNAFLSDPVKRGRIRLKSLYSTAVRLPQSRLYDRIGI
jgi:hypothetical protein